MKEKFPYKTKAWKAIQIYFIKDCRWLIFLMFIGIRDTVLLKTGLETCSTCFTFNVKYIIFIPLILERFSFIIFHHFSNHHLFSKQNVEISRKIYFQFFFPFFRWYGYFPCMIGDDDSPFWQGWANLRIKTFRLIENKYFETAVIAMILLSSLALVSLVFKGIV